MSNLSVAIVCFCNGKMVRTQTNVDYVGDRVVVEPTDVPLKTTYEQLLEIIYLVTDINREHFQLILSCKYPMKRGNKFQPCLVKNDSSVARMLEMHNRFEMDEVELFVEQVSIDLQMNSPLGSMPLLLGEMMILVMFKIHLLLSID